MIAAPSTIQRSSFSSTSRNPHSATTGSCMKLIGVSAETSPSLSARVHGDQPQPGDALRPLPHQQRRLVQIGPMRKDRPIREEEKAVTS
jgi:hypothetical protein